MTDTYEVTGMTCGSCEAKVKSALLKLENVNNVEVSKDNNSAIITMEKFVPISTLQKALDDKYKISAKEHNESAKETTSWFKTYKPILLLFAYILGAVLLIEYSHPPFNSMEAMRYFMAIFFLVFSFFKMLDLKGFADAYQSYDIIAKSFPAWGYIYPFIELALGIAYLLNFDPITTNSITLIVMTISIIGVLQSVLNQRKIKCACLGTVFNLPMSTITIVEDGLMIAMSAYMLIQLTS